MYFAGLELTDPKIRVIFQDGGVFVKVRVLEF